MAWKTAIVLAAVLLLSGCGTKPLYREVAPSDEPTSTRKSRPGDPAHFSRDEEEATKNKTTLYFAQRPQMSLTAPSGYDDLEANVPSQYFFPNLGSSPLEFRYKATNKGKLVTVNATLWFRVTEPTPAFPIGCDFWFSIFIQSSPGSRSVSFPCGFGFPPSGAPTFSPGVYKKTFLASPGGNLQLKANDTLNFRISTTGYSFDVKPTILFLYGSREHDSNVHFVGWAEPPADKP